jgi:outer membrane protein assembly factor BamB
MKSTRLCAVAVLLVAVLMLSSALNAFAIVSTELAYDDGSSEGAFLPNVGVSDAVRFSLPALWSSARVLTARYCIGLSLPGVNSFTVRILDDDRATDLTPPFTATPSAGGWFDVDLTAKNIIVTRDFYVVIKNVNGMGYPAISVDYTAPISGRSWGDGMGYWMQFDTVNFMIRAVVAPGPDWPMFRHDQAHTGATTEIMTTASLTLRWNYTTGYWVHSSPAVSGGIVYVGSLDGNVYALNASTGAFKWSYTTGDYVYSSPAVSGGRVYVGSADNMVYALNASTGAKIWNYTTGGMVSSSPAVSGGRVYVGSDDSKVYALNASTGAFKWSYTTGDSVESSPAVSGGIVYVGSRDNMVYGLNASTGAKIWNYTTGNGVWSSPAVSGGIVYVGSDDHNVYALNASTGAFKWSYTTGDYVYSSPAVSGGIVYVGSLDGNVYALNASTGAFKWSYTTGDQVQSSPAVSGGFVYVGSYDGKVYAFAAPRVAELAGFVSSPTNSTLLVVGDIAINPHGSKPSGVYYQQGRDTTPLGFVSGMLDLPQPTKFDTNAAWIDATSGRPLSSIPQTLIFTIGGPDINGVTHYYEHTDVTADRAPVTWSEEGSNVIWRVRNGTVVVNVTQASTNVPPGTSDVFVIQVLRDADGRLVVLMYGERYTGTWAAAWYFKYVIYPDINSYPDTYYIVRWTDATSGSGADFEPGAGDTFQIIAQGIP